MKIRYRQTPMPLPAAVRYSRDIRSIIHRLAYDQYDPNDIKSRLSNIGQLRRLMLQCYERVGVDGEQIALTEDQDWQLYQGYA